MADVLSAAVAWRAARIRACEAPLGDRTVWQALGDAEAALSLAVRAHVEADAVPDLDHDEARAIVKGRLPGRERVPAGGAGAARRRGPQGSRPGNRRHARGDRGGRTVSQVVTTPKGIKVEFRQHDWCPGFAAYLSGPGPLQPNGTAFCVVNLGGFLGNHAMGVMTREEMADEIAKSMVHEVVHVIEDWARVEFSEERVERVLASYEKYAVAPGEDHSLIDGIGALGCAKDGMTVRRRSWGDGVYVDHVADRGNGQPLLRIHRPGREWDAYHPCSDDLLAEDWEVVYAETEGEAS